ncbi:MAG TPA: GGDEF domain-containing protein [Candidatus Acidoferrales bacterium]|nr:GGDEF domain-containing protein [Candidatus Acidoferrales bacterium]
MMIAETTPVSVWTALAGFYCATALLNAVAAAALRSAASAAFAVFALVLAAIELQQLAGGAPAAHAFLIALYLVNTVVLGLMLLRTMRYDTAVGQVTIGLLGVNVLLAFVENPEWLRRFAVFDRVAAGALVAALAIIGVRSMAHESRAIASAFLAGLVGAGVATLAAGAFGPVPVFEAGTLWQTAFFAVAVVLRNRGVAAGRGRVERLAYLDGLTGVANRRTFDETLERLWNVARRAQFPLAVLMIDVDHFKRLNDTRGHQVGDECLRRVAALCASVLRRAGDCFARYGGEEFGAILVNLDATRAQALAEHIRRTVESDGGITVSIGLAARVPSTGDSALKLVADADDALYRAKHEGRNCVRIATAHGLEV